MTDAANIPVIAPRWRLPNAQRSVRILTAGSKERGAVATENLCWRRAILKGKIGAARPLMAAQVKATCSGRECLLIAHFNYFRASPNIEEKGCEKEGTHSPNSDILKSTLRTSRKPLGREGCQILYVDYSVAIEIFT